MSDVTRLHEAANRGDRRAAAELLPVHPGSCRLPAEAIQRMEPEPDDKERGRSGEHRGRTRRCT
jgi:hypothetical protein